VVTLVDTPGAFPGPAAEERGQSEAIASSIRLMTGLRVPIVAVIVGEGGSGGALAIGVGDHVLALENAVYSVISPEGCASILWRTSDEAPTAALAMRMTAADQRALGVVDIVVGEPAEGAHGDHAEMARRLRTVLVAQLDALDQIPIDELLEARYRRYRSMGAYTEVDIPAVTPPASLGLADRLRNLLDQARATAGGSIPGPSRSRDEPPAREEV
jgi:acetyl-CoA carboxylase carboxyl transferase subunit alpha